MAFRTWAHPTLLCATGGAALILGVATALPVWEVPFELKRWVTSGTVKSSCSVRIGTGWEAIAGTSEFVKKYDRMPCWDWQLRTFGLASTLLTGGAVMGVLLNRVIW